MARGAKVAPSGDGGKETKESTYKKVNETSETAIEVKSSEKKKGQKIKGDEKYEGVKGEESIGENDDEKHSKKKNDNKKKNKDKGKKDTEVKEGEQEEEEEEEEDDGDGRILEPLQIETTEFDMERARQVLTGTNERDVEALAGMLDEKAQKRLKKIQEKRRAKKEKEEDAKQYVSHSPVADKDILGSVGPIRKGEGTKKKKKPTINLTNNADADYIKQFKRSLMQRPSKKRAKEHRNDNVPRDKTNSGRLVPCNVKSFPDFRFGEFGVGHKAYFFMIKKMLLILSIMLAYSVPLLILYVGAEYFGQGSPSASMTMGNIGPAKDVNGTALEVSFFGSEVSRSSLCFVAVLADLLIVVLVGWRISKLAAAQLREDKLLKEREDNVQLYTVWVKDVPPEANDEFLYKNFFRARGGPVQNIEIIMDTENLLDLMMQRGEIAVLQREAAYAKDENRLNKLSTRRKNLEDEIKEVLERCEAEPKCLGAFVSFQDEYSRNNCLKMYTIAGRKLKYPKQLHLKEKQITVMPAPPPEDILFPNLTVTAKERKIRRVISISLQTIISLVLLGILVYLKSSTDNFKEEMTQCAGLDVSLEDAEANGDIAVCYCKTIGVNELLLGSSSDVCADYITFQQSLYQIAFAVLVFNSIATNLARRFAAFERHEQLSVREMSTTWTL